MRRERSVVVWLGDEPGSCYQTLSPAERRAVRDASSPSRVRHPKPLWRVRFVRASSRRKPRPSPHGRTCLVPDDPALPHPPRPRLADGRGRASSSPVARPPSASSAPASAAPSASSPTDPGLHARARLADGASSSPVAGGPPSSSS